MTTSRHETEPGPAGIRQDANHDPGHVARGKRGGHGLMVMLMCVPMLLVSGFLVVTDAAGSGALVAALLCMAMMAAMMFMMRGGHSHK